MQELVELWAILYSDRLETDARSLYNLKLQIIERNLYGVDIDEFAVNIAMLRMWLSLAIEFEGDRPDPLPNLDFKVICGDSLLGPDPDAGTEVQGSLGQDRETMLQLGRLKADYMGATSDQDKGRLRQRIRDLAAEVRAALGVTGIPADVVDWRLEFADVFAGRGGFDIAIANPPYVRQEKIGAHLHENEPPTDNDREVARAYKRTLERQYSAAVTARSDLYCHFYARALQLLTERGSHVFVCSNSWLDVGYGGKLQEYLLRNGRISAVYESALERQFSTADVNTVITIANKTPSVDEDETRFVSLRDQFQAAITNHDLRREVVKSRVDLLIEGSVGKKYVGGKWGGKFLRAPDIFHHILDKYSARLVRLGDLATVRYGVKTGANEFFYLTKAKIEEWGIEEEFCHAAMTTPQESRRLAVDLASLPRSLFVCHEEKAAIRGTGALAYIEWGESQGYHKRRSTASRRRWYDLGERATTRTALNLLIGTTARMFLVERDILFTHNFITVRGDPAEVSPLQICTSLNSTVVQLSLNLAGRVNFGQGVLEIQTYELEKLLIPDPRLLPELDSAIFSAEDWDVLTPSVERQRIDNVVFDSLGLTTEERSAVYDGVSELVRNRELKAASV